ncbi:MAG: autotransporter assembly complex family protein [Gammaproteobacteria bacterium]|jgi:translocation and assembly module TamA
MKLKFLLIAWLLLWTPLVMAEQRVEIEITGLDKQLQENVRAHLGIARLAPQTGIIPLTAGEQEQPVMEITETSVRRLHRQATRDIDAALQPFGYYEPVVDARLSQDGETWRAVYHIDPGPPTRIDQLDIQISGAGQADAGILAARKASRLQQGGRLLHSDYEATKQALLQAALSAGYLDARYRRAELRIFKARQQAQIHLLLDTGPRYFFGPISIEQDILDPDFVQQYVHIREGEPFSTDALLKLQMALSDSGYFNRVEIDPQRTAAEDFHVPVVVTTKPAKPRRYAVGLGYGTDTGPRISLASEFRRINRRGHGILADIRLSNILQSTGVKYYIPIGNMVSDKLLYSSRIESESFADGGSSDRFTLGVSRNEEWGPLQRRLYVNYQHENFSLGDDDGNVDFFIPGFTLSQLQTDNVLFPRRGYSWSTDLRGSPGVISNTSFARIDLAGKLVFPLGERSRLLLRSRLGAMSVQDFNSLPTSERFFAGGDQSVRGYDYQTLAPKDASGDVIGGQYLATGSIELDHLFVGNFGAAVFVDSGNAADDFLPSPKTGAGIGFRWRSPVGMLRIDVAHPFDDSDDNYRLHISIGPTL